jgi:hypothetical protein
MLAVDREGMRDRFRTQLLEVKGQDGLALGRAFTLDVQ